MKYNFDKAVVRCQTGSVKWDLAEDLFGMKGLLPMWVADMDFEAPKPVVDALEARVKHGIYGYTACMPSYYEAIMDWEKKRHGWNINREWIVFSPGVVPALSMLIQAFSSPGDKVILQLPVYYPFMDAVVNNKRRVLNNPLKLINGKYRMDFEDLEKKAVDPRAKLLILCSPHNPVGRVWTEKELATLGNICIENNILIVSDEIHCDLILKGYRHVPFASISGEFLANSVTCTSPSKTFNLAGLHVSNVIIADTKKRHNFSSKLKANGIIGPNAFGTVALEAAYRHGEEWLEQVLEYIQSNLEFLKKFVTGKIPQVRVIEPEATYLVWLDFRELGLGKKELQDLIRRKAGVALDDGYIFGDAEGAGFERINIACPGSILEEGLKRIEKALINL